MSAVLKIKSGLLVLLLSINMLSLSIFTITFEANRAYFTEKYCVNKSKPQLQCNGKCHLKKVTKQLQQEETSSTFQAPKIQFEYLTVTKSFSEEQALTNTLNPLHQFRYVKHYIFLSEHEILDPPRV